MKEMEKPKLQNFVLSQVPVFFSFLNVFKDDDDFIENMFHMFFYMQKSKINFRENALISFFFYKLQPFNSSLFHF